MPAGATASGGTLGHIAWPCTAGRVRPVAKGAESPRGPGPGAPACAPEDEDAPEAQAAWSREERRCVEDLLSALQRARVLPPPEGQLLQVAWSRKLDPEASAALWRQHLEAARCLNVMAVSDEDVRQAYSTGYFVRAGKDVEGRPIIWVRLALSEVPKLTPSLAIRNTWLAQDATLCGSVDANRRGICFVYDLRGVGLGNLISNLKYLHVVIWGAASHPVHVSRIWLLNAPAAFLAAWHLVRGFLPRGLRQVVRFCSTGEGGGRRADRLAPVCGPGELPAYMGGDADRFGGDYAEWMFARLQGQPLAYRREGSTFTLSSEEAACENSRQLRAVQLGSFSSALQFSM